MTITAICAGLTGIRFGYQGDYDTAVQLVLVACVLDGMDGGLARFLKCPSLIGAELDSLADFLNFGVAPALIIYSWGFSETRSAGWIAVLVYAVCCVLRLARFNVGNQPGDKATSNRFVGVPSPAGAVLVMFPMVLSFQFANFPVAPPTWIAFYMLAIGLLMISTVPTYAIKNITIDRENAKFLLLGTAVLVACLLTHLWATLVVLTLAYFVSLGWAIRSSFILPKT